LSDPKPFYGVGGISQIGTSLTGKRGHMNFANTALASRSSHQQWVNAIAGNKSKGGDL
jgi:hypothetical protein